METERTELKQNSKVVLKGKIAWVGPIEEVGENKMKKQSIVFVRPPYNNGFENVGKDEYWMLDALGDKIAQLGITEATHKDKFATVAFYVGSSAVAKKDKPEEFMYIVNNRLAEIQLYVKKPQ